MTARMQGWVWEEADNQRFVNYVHRNGGKVNKIIAWKAGYEFDIIPPDNVRPSDMMVNFIHMRNEELRHGTD
jgi:hypothetical protein